MKIIYFFKLLFIILVITQCVAVPPGGGGAYFINKFKAPYKTFPFKQGEIEGKSSAQCLLSLFCWGDATVTKAARESNIKYVTNIEYEYFNVFIFYSKTTIIVWGKESEK